MNTAIEVKNLEKSYGRNKVLKGVSFSVGKGEIFAILGINGAGKTTMLECIEGLRKYESGTIQVNGRFGVQLQSSSIPEYMKAEEAFTYFAKWQHTKVNRDLLVNLGIDSFLKQQYAQLSTGQKRRIHLGMALLGNPEIVFLDEPTAGLDVEGRVSIHEEIQKLKVQGKTIILASHDMSEVEDLCDKIAVIKDGKIVFLGTAEEMTETAQSRFVLKVRFSKDPNIDNIPSSDGIQKDRDYYIFKTTSLEAVIFEIMTFCEPKNIVMNDLKVEHAGIEQRFLQIAKED